MLTWKQIREVIEAAHPVHPVSDDTRLTYLMVHQDSISYGLVGQGGFSASVRDIHGWVNPEKNAPILPAACPSGVAQEKPLTKL